MYKFLLTLGILSVTFGAKAQTYGDWTKGYYIDSNNQKHVGYLCIEEVQTAKRKLTFRKEIHMDDVKLLVENLKSLVIGKDTFEVSHDPYDARAQYMQPVLRKTMTLYVVYDKVHRSATASFGVPSVGISYSRLKKTYYYGSNPDDVVEVTRKNFASIMSGLMEDKPLLIYEIKQKNFTYSDMQDLITAYKTGILEKLPESEESADN